MSQADVVIEGYAHRWAVSRDNPEEQYVPEKYQLGIVTDFLRSAGIEYATEQSVFSYPIDVLCINEDETIAIELKSRNVGKGIKQTLRDSDYVDYAFLAVWAEDASESLVERVFDLPIGLMAVGESVEILSTPEKTAQQLCRRSMITGLVTGNV